MQFLDICKMVCREAGIPNGEDAITAVTGQTGEAQRIIKWVASAWIEVQNKYTNPGQYWRWMRRGFTLATVDGTDAYAYTDADDDVTSTTIARFKRWMIENPTNPPKIYLTSGGEGGEGWLHYMPWDDFKYLYRLGTQTDQQPIHVTVDDRNRLVLGPVPDGVYTVTGDFMLGNQTLAANADEPEMPSDFHELLAWMALKRYGLYESAPEAVTNGEYHEKIFLGDLIDDQLSMITTAGPMV